MIIKTKFGLFTTLLLAMLLVFVLVNALLLPKSDKVFIDGDGSGHYAYLPALLIHRTVDFTILLQEEKARKSADYVGHNYHERDGVTINKFAPGTAFMLAPFFVVAALLSKLFGLPIDGYQPVFQYAVGVGAVFWLSVGLFFLIQMLKLYRIKQNEAVLFSVFGLFATNLFFYAYINPSFSHVYSFAAITSFYYFITLFFKSRQKQHLFFSAFMLGIVVLIRPVNLLAILAVPFFAGGFSLFWMHLRNTISVKWLLTSVVIFLFALLPMFVISYLQTGSLIIYGYQNEGFYFLRPHFFDFLFSFKKGWFLYTPAMLLLFPAGVFLFRHQRSGFYAFSFFLIILIYVFSSWWNWFYGDSFGMRPMVDFYGLFILIIALFATKIKSYSAKMTLLVFVGLTIFLNIFQSYQYAVGIIHPDSMTKQGYWHVFLERDEEFRGVIAGGDEYFYGKLDETPLLSSLNTIDRLPSGWNLNDNTVIVDKDSKSLVVEQNSDFIYSPSYSFPYPENSKYGKHVYVNFGFKFLEKSPNAALNALVVIDISDSLGQHPFYKAFRFKRLPDNENSSWRDASVGFKLPPYHTDYKQVKLYVWNKNAQDYLLDSLHVTLYNY